MNNRSELPDIEKVVHLNFYDLLILIARWRKLFIINFLIVTVVTSVMVMLMPVWFRATTVVLPPAGGGGGLPSFLSKDLAGVAANFGLEMPTEEIYQTILGSRTLKERMINKFDLRKVYKLDDGVKPEDVLLAFDAHYSIFTRDDKAIEVSFEDRNPQRAADIANACVAELDNYYREITGRSAHNNRVFIERRLGQITDTLHQLQDQMLRFQIEHNTVSIPEQTTAMIGAAAELKAQQISAEIQLQVLRNTLGESHPDVQQMKSSSSELEKRYFGILEGSEGDLFLALSQLPELTRKYAEIVRQMRIMISLQEFVYPQFENARILEERETSNIQVLDYARVPFKKVKPARRLIVTFAGAASLLMTLLMIMLIEYWTALPGKNRNDWSKVMQLKNMLRRNK